jgi:biotin transport system substrate-specific component
VFAQGGGLVYILNPSFGYLLGFPFASFAAGIIVHRGFSIANALPPISLARLIFANVSALLVIFFPGVLYLWLNFNFISGQPLSFVNALYGGCIIFLPGEAIKIVGVILLYRMLQPRLNASARFSGASN